MSCRAARSHVPAALVLSLIALASPRPASGQAAPFTLVAMPDTQNYTCTDGDLCSADEGIFDAQTSWIVANRDVLDIRFVAGLGDCVKQGDEPDQYAVADAAYRRIESAVDAAWPDGIPFGLAVGNRDQSPNGDPGSIPSVSDVLHPDQAETTTLFNSWFGVDRFCPGSVCRGYYGDHFGINNDNHYALFEANGYEFVVVFVEFMEEDSPLREAVIAWADEVLGTYADRRAIVVSHYVMKTGTDGPFSDQGEALYDVLKHHPNFTLMLGGHINGEGRRTDEFEGRTVHTIESDYDGRDVDDQGWLRILEFRPAEDQIVVRTYSPWLDEFETDSSSEFTLSYDMNGGFPDTPEPCPDGDADGVCDADDVCLGDDVFPDLEPDGVCNPSLEETAATPGAGMTLTLANGEPGATATFLLSTVGDDGPVRCAASAPVCTTLVRPIHLGSTAVDAQGAASVTVTIPATVPPGRIFHVQGLFTQDGAGQASEIDAVVVQ